MATPTVQQNVSTLLSLLGPQKTTEPYPTWSEACQSAAYQNIIQQFNATPGITQITDLRTDVYPNPTEYPPDSVYAIIENMTAPAVPSGCQASDWTTVYTQIQTETLYLTQLYNYQYEFIDATQNIATALTSGFNSAVGTFNANAESQPASGTVVLYAVLNGIFAAAALIPGLEEVAVVAGVVAGVLESIPGGNGGVQGDLSTLQNDLGSWINKANTQASNLYAPICASWGLLQKFAGIVSSLGNPSANVNLQSISDQYEISIYQAVAPSVLGWVQVSDKDGVKATYLAYQTVAMNYGAKVLPTNATTMNNRLSQLGVSMSTAQGWRPEEPYQDRGMWQNPLYEDSFGITVSQLPAPPPPPGGDVAAATAA